MRARRFEGTRACYPCIGGDGRRETTMLWSVSRPSAKARFSSAQRLAEDDWIVYFPRKAARRGCDCCVRGH